MDGTRTLVVALLAIAVLGFSAVALAGDEVPNNEVPISWDAGDPAAGGRAVGRADAPLVIWEALEVEADGPYTMTVRSVYGEVLAKVCGETAARLDLHGSDPLRIIYDGPPARIRLLSRERRMAVIPAPQGALARYETGNAVVPAGVSFRSERVVLQPGSGLKARLVCGVWGGADLRVVFRDDTGAELGHADLTAGRSCGLVYGRVNRPYTLEIIPAGTAQVYDLEVR